MIREFRLGMRRLWRQPGQMLAAVLALALGIGLTAAMFSIIDGSLLRKPPVNDPERLVRVERRALRAGGVRPAELQAWREKQTSFSQLVGWFPVETVFSGDGRSTENYRGAYVSAQFFDAVGVQPLLGRGFLPEEDRENVAPVVVLGDELWSRRYQRNPKVLGQVVRLGGEPATIVGVFPPGFKFPVNEDYWLPLGNVLPFVSTNGIALEVFGRLRPGVRAERAQTELDLLADGANGNTPSMGPKGRTVITGFSKAYTESARRPLWLMMGAVAGVLLIACANVANLLLARGLLRERDLAVRAALGARGRSLAAPVLAEAFLLAGLGALGGLILAKVCISLYNASGGLVRSFWVNVRLDARALLFVVGVTLFATLLSGLVPALRAARIDAGGMLKDQSQSAGSLRIGQFGRTLVAVQIALSCALLTGTGQMIESVRNLYRQDFGDSPEKVWTAQIMLDPQRRPKAEEWLRFYSELTKEVDAIPGVRSVALVSHLPATPTPRAAVEMEGAEDSQGNEPPTARWSLISPGYFAALGRPVLKGRDFLLTDTAGTPPVVLVNRSFVERHFHGRNPIGQRIRLAGPRFQGRWVTIVGEVPNLYLSWDYFSDRIDTRHPEGIYLPLAQRPQPGIFFLIRSDLSPAAIVAAVRKTLARLDPETPPLKAETLEQRIAAATADYRMVRTVFSVLGVAGLVLSGLGLYGVVAFLAGQRRREIAVRMAMGAQIGDVLKLVAQGGALQIGVGAAVGVGLAAMTSRFLGALLFGIAPGDFTSLAGAILLLFLVAAAACFQPARRALKVDPAAVLRNE